MITNTYSLKEAIRITRLIFKTPICKIKAEIKKLPGGNKVYDRSYNWPRIYKKKVPSRVCTSNYKDSTFIMIEFENFHFHIDCYKYSAVIRIHKHNMRPGGVSSLIFKREYMVGEIENPTVKEIIDATKQTY